MYLYVLTYLYYLWKNPAMQIQNKKKFKSIFQLKKNSDTMVCVWILVFNTTFNNISVISVLFVEESGENY